ncbi:MAG: hypothetical protein AAFV33_26245 [Chloroflexota bacterium]
MMTRNRISQNRLEQIEMNSLAWQTMTRIARGETLVINGVYLRMARMLNDRAIELEAAPEIHPQSKNDWLALALFAKNREWFLMLCKQAEHNKSLLFMQARPWLQQIIDADIACLVNKDNRDQ